MKETTKEQRDAARATLRADYWSDVRGIVEDARRAIKDGEISSPAELDDWLHETVDGHQRVIYTHAALETLMFCESDGDAEESLDFIATQSVHSLYSQIAYYGLLGDARKQAEAEGLYSFDSDEDSE